MAGDAQHEQASPIDELYESLRRIAAAQMRHERGGHTLDATAVVHEAWIRMRSVGDEIASDRVHFASVAAATIRRVLVDHARERNSLKRGGEFERVGLLTQIADITEDVDMLELHEALDRLATVNRDCARVVELRFFAGLSLDEAASVMGIGRSTVVRLWRGGRAWLKSELTGAQHDQEPDHG